MVAINPDDFLKHTQSSIEITEVFFNREVTRGDLLFMTGNKYCSSL